MTQTLSSALPTLHGLPVSLPREGAIEIELGEPGVLIFRVSGAVQDRIEALLDKRRAAELTEAERQELQQYEEIDDYLSFLNRLTRNLAQAQQEDDGVS